MSVTEKMKVPPSVMFIWYILGICMMLPWNFFITADKFWQYKLRNTSLGNDWNDPEHQLTDLQVSFIPTVVIVSNLVVFICGFVISALLTRFKEKTRILGSFCISFIAMIVVTVLSLVNTDNWQEEFFIITMIMIGLINVGIAFLQGSFYGLVGLFPKNCGNCLFSGQAIAGLISSLSMIISLAIGDADPIVSGIIYFTIADVFIVISAGAYFWLLKMDIYKTCKTIEISSDVDDKAPRSWKDYIRILKKVKGIGFTLGFVLCVTLAVYPAVTVYISSSMSTSTWTQVYFQPTINFLLFNAMDVFGRELTRFFNWPKHEGWILHILGLARVAFIPLFLLCNGENKGFPTVFYNDAYFIIFHILFAISNGYVSVKAMHATPKILDEEEIELGGAIMASLMGVGMLTGSFSSPGFVLLLGPKTS